METKIRLQKFGISDLLNESLQIYRSKFKDILFVILCIYLPINTIIAVATNSYFTKNYEINELNLYNNALNFFVSLIGVIATMSIALIADRTIEGQNLTWLNAIKHSLSKWGKAVITGLLAGLITLALTFLLIIPGIIYTQYYTFWIFVVTLRNISGKEALDYSKSLVEGQWWRIFGIQFIFGIASLAIGFIITYPFSLVTNNIFLSVIINTLKDITTVFFTITSILLFLNNDYVHSPKVIHKIPPLESL